MKSLALMMLVACSNSTAGVDASPLTDAAVAIDAAAGCAIVINEVAAAGQPNDWFEVVNRSAAAVDLVDYRFIDEAADPASAVAFAPAILAPGSRTVQEVTSADHGFALGADDALWLYRLGVPSPCDSVDWVAGDAPAGGSYGRVPDGSGQFQTTEPDTRGVPN